MARDCIVAVESVLRAVEETFIDARSGDMAAIVAVAAIRALAEALDTRLDRIESGVPRRPTSGI